MKDPNHELDKLEADATFDESEVQQLFDQTAADPSEAAIQRMSARAAESPEAALQQLFDATAEAPDAMLTTRLAARAADIPARATRRPAWLRVEYWLPGLAVAAAPLMVYPSALAGGDAAALGVAAVALVLARRHPLAAGLIFAASLMVKPVTFPLILVLAARHPLALVTALPALAAPALAPLVQPSPRRGCWGVGGWPTTGPRRCRRSCRG